MRYILNSLSFIILISIALSCSPSGEKTFEKEAEEQNRLYPMMIDPYTRIDSIRYIAAGNTFCYYYTLIADADNAYIAAQRGEKLKSELPAEIKKAPGLAIHRKHKVIMEYIYFSESSGNELLRITITPEMYLK